MKISDFQFDVSIKETDQKHEAAYDGSSFEELFSNVVRVFPDRVALVDDEMSLSFAELDTISSAIASFILKMNYGDEAVVGVLCERGNLVLAAAFGAMRAGAVYLPVEKELPLPRQEIMLKPAQLILADSSSLREAEYFQHKIPGISHILCLDAPEFEDAIEKGTELKSTAFWEHIADRGSDQGWKSYFDAKMVSMEVLEDLPANILTKSNIAGKKQKRILDIGSGSGVVAKGLIDASSQYTAVELAQNELDRVEEYAVDNAVKVHQMEAIDICFRSEERRVGKEC